MLMNNGSNQFTPILCASAKEKRDLMKDLLPKSVPTKYPKDESWKKLIEKMECFLVYNQPNPLAA